MNRMSDLKLKMIRWTFMLALALLSDVGIAASTSNSICTVKTFTRQRTCVAAPAPTISPQETSSGGSDTSNFYMNLANYPIDGYDYSSAQMDEGHFGAPGNDCFVIQTITRSGSKSSPDLPDAPLYVICRKADGSYAEMSQNFFGKQLFINGGYPLAADFNNDGVDDIFVIRGWDGYYPNDQAYALISQPGGVYAVNNVTINNPYNYSINVQNTVLDYNQDGCLDVYNALQILFAGDCHGGFTSTSPDFSKVQGTIPESSFYGTGICAADYLGNGMKQVVLTDGGGELSSTPNAVMSINSAGQLTSVIPLPVPYFDGVFHANATHSFSCRSSDINSDGRPDILVFTRPQAEFTNNQWVDQSYIQAYLNMGSGVFKDISSTAFPGYNLNSAGSYSSIVRDVNQDGFLDLITEGQDYEGFGSFGNQTWINAGDQTFRPEYTTQLNDMAIGAGTILHGGIDPIFRLSMLPFPPVDGNEYLTFIRDANGRFHIDVVIPRQ
jgi:FG-GAP-like repeat